VLSTTAAWSENFFSATYTIIVLATSLHCFSPTWTQIVHESYLSHFLKFSLTQSLCCFPPRQKLWHLWHLRCMPPTLWVVFVIGFILSGTGHGGGAFAWRVLFWVVTFWSYGLPLGSIDLSLPEPIHCDWHYSMAFGCTLFKGISQVAAYDHFPPNCSW